MPNNNNNSNSSSEFELHTLLASVKSKQHQANVVLTGAKRDFKRDGIYTGSQLSVSLYKESGELGETEQTGGIKVSRTAKQELELILKEVGEWLDAEASKEETNGSGSAKAELFINGISFGTHSSTTYLKLDKELTAIREVLKDLPVRDTTKDWVAEETPGVYRTDTVKTPKTEKITEHRITVPGTDKFPAQTQPVTFDKVIGFNFKINYDAGLSIMEKVELLSRLDDIIQACLEAKSRANKAPVVKSNIATRLLKYAFTGESA